MPETRTRAAEIISALLDDIGAAAQRFRICGDPAAAEREEREIVERHLARLRAVVVAHYVESLALPSPLEGRRPSPPRRG